MRRKELAWIFLIILILNLILFALQIIGVISFWIIIMVGALVAYKIMPNLKS